METAAQHAIPESSRQFLRHVLATLAYRTGKTLRGAPPEFAGFRASPDTRTPAEVLAHMGDLMDWGLSIVSGNPKFRASGPLAWDAEVQRFCSALAAFDAYLASGQPVHADLEKLFQGGLADAFTHTGQLGMLRRLAGCPVRGENYFMADIVPGRVGLGQSAPKREFD